MHLFNNNKTSIGLSLPNNHKKRNSTKRKEALGSNFPSHSAKERLHYVASHSVKLQIWGFTLSLTVGRNHLNRNQNKISPESPLTHSPWRKALHVSTMKQIIQPISKSEDSLYYLLLSSHSGENPHNCTQCNFEIATRKTLGFHLHTHTGENPYQCIQCN